MLSGLSLWLSSRQSPMLFRPLLGEEGATVRAQRQQRALLAQRPPRGAEPPAMAEKVDVDLVAVLRVHERAQLVVGLFEGGARADQPESRGDPVDVGVDGDLGHVVREEEDAGRRLSPDAR